MRLAYSSSQMGADQAMEEGVYDDRRAEREAKAKVLASQPDIYQKLIASFAPSIYEMDDVKKGLLCQVRDCFPLLRLASCLPGTLNPCAGCLHPHGSTNP